MTTTAIKVWELISVLPDEDKAFIRRNLNREAKNLPVEIEEEIQWVNDIVISEER